MKSNNKYEAKKYISKVMPEQKVRAHLAVRWDCNMYELDRQMYVIKYFGLKKF